MHTGRCGNGSGIDLLRKIRERFRDADAELFRDLFRSRCVRIVDRGEFGRGKFRIKPGVIFPNVPDAHDSNTEFLHLVAEAIVVSLVVAAAVAAAESSPRMNLIALPTVTAAATTSAVAT